MMDVSAGMSFRSGVIDVHPFAEAIIVPGIGFCFREEMKHKSPRSQTFFAFHETPVSA